MNKSDPSGNDASGPLGRALARAGAIEEIEGPDTPWANASAGGYLIGAGLGLAIIGGKKLGDYMLARQREMEIEALMNDASGKPADSSDYASNFQVIRSNNQVDLLSPGPFAQKSILAGPSPRPTAQQQKDINDLGNKFGCHSCGATTPGTKSGNWIGDHQNPTALNPPGTLQFYFPHCKKCSTAQGPAVQKKLREGS